MICYFVWPKQLPLISLFPLENYNQNVQSWINPLSPTYDEVLLNTAAQSEQFKTFDEHYFGKFSPWNARYIQQMIHQPAPDDLLSIEKSLLVAFNNLDKPEAVLGYGANFRAYAPDWLNTLSSQINLSSLDKLPYQEKHRAIAVDNLQVRVLPTEDPYFYSYKLAGQGYPFDYLQMSAIWAGTPLYVLSETQDHAWSLVVTPELIGWVKSNGLAYANQRFINTWTKAARNKLAAIVLSQTPIVNSQGNFRFFAYVGAVFPATAQTAAINIMLPVADRQHQAQIEHALLTKDQAALMPLPATAHQFSRIIAALIGRPYGWGGIYFYNDCSAELKSLFTPFGIWLPRHSSDQVYAGKLEDWSPASPEQRLAALRQKGRPFLTIVHLGGHVFLYLGNYMDPNTKNTVALTYQNVWGLSPKPPLRRMVLGKAVLLPLLLTYPEDRSLISHAGKQYFQVSYLDETPNYRIKLETLDLRRLMGLG